MDGFRPGAAPDFLISDIPPPLAAIDRSWRDAPGAAGLIVRRLDDLDTLVVTKSQPGFDAATVEAVRQIVRDAAAGRLGLLKFLALDFAHAGEGEAVGGAGFDCLVSEAANLILHAPIVSVANVRGHLNGADLEFALACSMMIGEAGARFSFDADPIVAIGAYGFLAQKIGFVRAERLMEGAEVLDAAQMQELLLVKAVTEPGSGLAGVRQFVGRTARRHNSFYGIYRAHRIAVSGRRAATDLVS